MVSTHSRRQRRCQRAQQREARRWERDVLRFHAASMGALQTYIIAEQDRPRLVMAALSGEATAAALVKLLVAWTKAAEEPGAEPPLCLDCGGAFGPNHAAVAHVIWAPFANHHEHAIAGGVCAGCAERGDLRQIALKGLRLIFPGATDAAGGHG